MGEGFVCLLLQDN